VGCVRISASADIIVAGGGPAGSTISRLLAGLGYRVVLLEKRRFPRHQIGESLTPSILPVLDFLGVRTRVEEADSCVWSSYSLLGSPQPRTGTTAPTTAVVVFKRGGRISIRFFWITPAVAGCRCLKAERQLCRARRGCWSNCTYPQGHIEAAFFVDASGHTGVLAGKAFVGAMRLFKPWH